MKEEKSKVCPACGTRNKAKWEFCVRCGESLLAVDAEAGAASAAPATATTIEDAEAPSSPLASGLLIVLMIGIVVGVVMWTQRQPEPETAVGTSVFQLPPQVTPPPATTVAASKATEHANAGRQLMSQGNHAAAALAFAKALETEPDDAELNSLYAQALFHSGQRDQGLQHFDRAARLSSEPRYRLGYAAALNLAGKNQEAAAQYELVLVQAPQDQQALKELGSLYNRMGRFEEAVQYLSRAAEINPTDIALVQDLAWARESRGELDQAAEAYRRVVAARPQAAVSRVRLAEVLLKQQKNAEALALVEEGLAQDPAVPLLRRARASLLERSGRIAEAIAEYREYARIAPNADDARVITERANALEKRSSGGTS